MIQSDCIGRAISFLRLLKLQYFVTLTAVPSNCSDQAMRSDLRIELSETPQQVKFQCHCSNICLFGSQLVASTRYPYCGLALGEVTSFTSCCDVNDYATLSRSRAHCVDYENLMGREMPQAFKPKFIGDVLQAQDYEISPVTKSEQTCQGFCETPDQGKPPYYAGAVMALRFFAYALAKSHSRQGHKPKFFATASA